MTLKELKIGYVPYLPDLSQPGDRRRFPHFAKRSQIPFEIANVDHEYDIVLLTATSNLSRWLAYKRKYPGTKFLFEMVDSLVFPSNLFVSLFKGMGRYLIKKEDRLLLNYQWILNEWIKVADGVICSNRELQNYVLKRNRNAFLSPDYLESEYSIHKTDYSIKGKMKLVWEGQSSVLPHFLKYHDLFKQINHFCELHIITEERYPYLPKLIYRPVRYIFSKIPMDITFHKWDIDTHTQILTSADCAIIPINAKNKFGWFKPANKLVSFWFSGLPTVVSGTPAYKELMDRAGNTFYCFTKEEWISKVKETYEMTSNARKCLSEKNIAFVKQNYSDESLDNIWRDIFKSVER